MYLCKHCQSQSMRNGEDTTVLMNGLTMRRHTHARTSTAIVLAPFRMNVLGTGMTTGVSSAAPSTRAVASVLNVGIVAGMFTRASSLPFTYTLHTTATDSVRTTLNRLHSKTPTEARAYMAPSSAMRRMTPEYLQQRVVTQTCLPRQSASRCDAVHQREMRTALVEGA
jgi:hypothetical protein